MDDIRNTSAYYWRVTRSWSDHFWEFERLVTLFVYDFESGGRQSDLIYTAAFTVKPVFDKSDDLFVNFR